MLLSYYDSDDDEYTNLCLSAPALSTHILLTFHLLLLPSLSHYTLSTLIRYSENDSVNAAIADVIASRSPDSKVPTDLHDPRVARRGGSPGRGSPSPGVPQSPTADGNKGLSTSTSSPGSFHKGPQEGDRQGGGRLPHIANNIKSHQLRRVRNSFAPEELYDNEGHLIVETTSRVRSAHLPGMSLHCVLIHDTFDDKDCTNPNPFLSTFYSYTPPPALPSSLSIGLDSRGQE